MKTKKNKINKILLKRIKEMCDLDQDIRFQSFYNKSLVNPLVKLANEKYNKKVPAPLKLGLGSFLVYMLDAAHNTKLWRIIEIYGYPTTKIIGKRGMFLFGVLVQHQVDDSKLQKSCLENCDFDAITQAHIIDKSLVAEGKRQLYGTQMKVNRKKKVVSPYLIENPKLVNIRRKALGIGPIEKDIKAMMKRIKDAE